MTLCEEQSGEVERALNRTEAAAALGISVRYFFDIRKKFETDFAVCEWRGRRPVFYRAHIEGLREAMTWTTKGDCIFDKPATLRVPLRRMVP
ncbi:hypothetical protein K1T73_15925 [Roseovarius sp. SCSIO 43702]|uniref:hypothetical protein n=1 Tax=Roseovarius sp. SCSIO 43702 TaxID=2823043 RepID=UPI001C72F342|nr:hypothetical protein [Roseovarius sp. SCSIO 43702]QYX56513.1 hypothetical protein K1T73_15925 [Roseovarius sp. SCSIO 43702]